MKTVLAALAAVALTVAVAPAQAAVRVDDPNVPNCSILGAIFGTNAPNCEWVAVKPGKSLLSRPVPIVPDAP